MPNKDNLRKETKGMGKISEMAEAVKDLRNTAAVLNEIADWLAMEFSTAEDAETAQEETPAPSLEQVRAILADKSRDGLTGQIRELLRKYGADRLSEVDPMHYRDLIREAEDLHNG